MLAERFASGSTWIQMLVRSLGCVPLLRFSNPSGPKNITSPDISCVLCGLYASYVVCDRLHLEVGNAAAYDTQNLVFPENDELFAKNNEISYGCTYVDYTTAGSCCKVVVFKRG